MRWQLVLSNSFVQWGWPRRYAVVSRGEDVASLIEQHASHLATGAGGSSPGDECNIHRPLVQCWSHGVTTQGLDTSLGSTGHTGAFVFDTQELHDAPSSRRTH